MNSGKTGRGGNGIQVIYLRVSLRALAATAHAGNVCQTVRSLIGSCRVPGLEVSVVVVVVVVVGGEEDEGVCVLLAE